jgi:hypothetical protein
MNTIIPHPITVGKIQKYLNDQISNCKISEITLKIPNQTQIESFNKTLNPNKEITIDELCSISQVFEKTMPSNTQIFTQIVEIDNGIKGIEIDEIKLEINFKDKNDEEK